MHTTVHQARALTVGESHEFDVRGRIISFVMDGSKVRPEINTAAARRAGLRLRSRLHRPTARGIDDPLVPE